MKRAKLIKRVSLRLNLNEIETGNFISSIFDTMLSVFKSGKNLNIPEFGKFIVRTKTMNGESAKFVSFSPCRKFADEINSNFSDLSPVLTKSLNFLNLSEIRVIEPENSSDEADFVYFTFDDGTEEPVVVQDETEIVFAGEPLMPDADIIEEEQTILEEILPPPDVSETVVADDEITLTDEVSETVVADDEITLTDEVSEIESADSEQTEKPFLSEVPCLIPFLYGAAGFAGIQEIDETDAVIKSREIFPESEISGVPFLTPDLNGFTSTVELKDTKQEIVSINIYGKEITGNEPVNVAVIENIGIPETELSDENIELIEPESANLDYSTDKVTAETDELLQTENTIAEPVSGEVITEKTEYDTIGEKIIREKEIVLKDIEEYIKSKEAEEKTESSTDPENYFTKENLDRLKGQEKDFSDSDLKIQNVFAEDFHDSEESSGKTDTSIDYEYEQTVFSDLENFFKAENETRDLPGEVSDDSISELEELPAELSGIVQPAENKATDTHQGNGKFTLKDEYDSSELIDSILDLLKSREHTIDELNKFGLVSAPETTRTEDTQKTPESATEENIQTEDTIPQDATTRVESVSSGEIVTEEQDKDLYSELDKRLTELEELKTKKDSIEEELSQKYVMPEMTVFEKLVEEKSEPETTEKISIPEIVIHDKGIPEIDESPKSLNEALDNLKLDGIIEHIDGVPVRIEEKSYEDVFKPADRPFVPVTNTLPPVKKRKFALKFIVYFFLIAVFSAMSFFLYKSILTPSRPKTFDTLETKANDSIIASLNLVDTSLSKGSIILSEFEVERDGDIVYRQTDNGYMIQVAVFDKYNDALKYISGLENKSIHAEIERVDLPLNVTEYRIVIGPFEKLQDAKAYFKSSGVILNFIKVLTPIKTGLTF